MTSPPEPDAARVALVTCDRLPGGDPDEARLAAASAELGLRCDIVSWSAPDVDWSAYEAVVLRSTWDYTDRRDEFLAWARSVPRLLNPYGVIAENTDKRYLATLAAAGLPVVPTRFVAPDESATLTESGDVVIKPSVGAGSRGAGRFALDDSRQRERALAHIVALQAAGRTVMIQPFVHGIEADGETALMYLDGRFSHAVRKGAMLSAGHGHAVDDDTLYVLERIDPTKATPEQRAVGDDLMRHLVDAGVGPLLYARVDLLPTASGPLIVELELTEPSLFLDHEPTAAATLAAALHARIAARP